MSLPDLLKNSELIEEFGTTKNEFRNFWSLIADVYVADPKKAEQYLGAIYGAKQKHYEALKIINKFPNLQAVLQQLTASLLDEMEAIYQNKLQLFQAVLSARDVLKAHTQIKNYQNMKRSLSI